MSGHNDINTLEFNSILSNYSYMLNCIMEFSFMLEFSSNLTYKHVLVNANVWMIITLLGETSWSKKEIRTEIKASILSRISCVWIHSVSILKKMDKIIHTDQKHPINLKCL